MSKILNTDVPLTVDNLKLKVQTFIKKAVGEKIDGKPMVESLNGFKATKDIGSLMVLRDPISILSTLIHSVDSSMLSSMRTNLNKKDRFDIANSDTNSEDKLTVKDDRDSTANAEYEDRLSLIQNFSSCTSTHALHDNVIFDYIISIFKLDLDTNAFLKTRMIDSAENPVKFRDTLTKIDNYSYLASKQNDDLTVNSFNTVKKVITDIVILNASIDAVTQYINLLPKKNDCITISLKELDKALISSGITSKKDDNITSISRHLLESSKILAILFFDGIKDFSSKESTLKGKISDTEEPVSVSSLLRSLSLISETMINEIFYKSGLQLKVKIVDIFRPDGSISSSVITNFNLPDNLQSIIDIFFITNNETTWDVTRNKIENPEFHITILGTVSIDKSESNNYEEVS